MAFSPPPTRAARRPRALGRALRTTATLAVATAAALALPAAGQAQLLTVGSPLSQPATLNTAENLNYQGTNTALGGTPEHPNGQVIHTYHYGADTALWNTSVGGVEAGMPAAGQARQIKLKGCAEQAPGGPSPLTQIHFQALSPTSGGGAKVALTSQPFDIPVCGQGGAGASTVTTFEPVNLCVNRGDFVDFNDEGGFVEPFYRSGVPYRVMAPASGSGMSSFIRADGTNNGAVFSPQDRTSMDGFAANPGQELLMQVVLGTGPDARYVCPGGTKDAPPVLSALSVHPQTAGVGRKRVIAVTIFCRPQSGCAGSASLTVGARHLVVGTINFNLQGNRSTSLRIHVSAKLLALAVHSHGHRVTATLTATMGATVAAGAVTVKPNSPSLLSHYH